MAEIEDINSELGNSILSELVQCGWEVTEEYAKDAFDKGIDFDSYTLKKNDATLIFEWDNWTEWIVKGDENTINVIRKKYKLSNT